MKKNIIKTLSTVVIITFIAKALGLLRDVVFANFYGTGYIATAFFTSIRIPTQLIDIVLSSAIVSVFVPIFNEILQKDGKEKANQFANNFINIVALVSTAIAILGIVFAPQVIGLLAGGLGETTFNLTVELIRITFPIIIFTAVAFSFVGLLQSYGEFNIPAMISGVSNLVVILFLVFFRDKFGIHGVAACMLLAWLLQVLIQLPLAKKFGYNFSLRVNFRDPNIKKVFLLAIPIIISTAVLPINSLVSTRLASSMEEGTVAVLEYAYKLYIVISGVFTYAIGNIIFPELSRASVEKNKEKYIGTLQKALKILMYILIPLTVGIIIFRKDIISVIYERGEFTSISTLLTSNALLFYSIGIIGAGVVEVMNKAFYAKQDTKTPLIVGIITICLNIGLCFILSKLLGYEGLALATSVTALINAIILIIFANKKEKGIIDKNIIIEFSKVALSTVVMFLVVYLLNNKLVCLLESTFTTKLVRMVIGAVSGVITYFIFTMILKTNILKEIKGRVEE